MMRIAYFAESLPPQTDGVSHTLSKLAEYLENAHTDYIFFSPFKPDETLAWSSRVRKVLSIPFPLYRYYRFSLPMFENLYSELDNFRPDLIHVTNPTALGIVGLDYARSKMIPAVSSYHTHFVHYFSYYGFKPIENLGWTYLKWFHNRCEMTYAPSRSTVTELVSNGIKNVTLWQRGIDLDNFSPTFRDPDLRRSVGADNIPVLLFVGRLVKEKDLDDLINALTILKKSLQKFKMVFVGEGPMQAELQQKLPDAHFTGFLKGEMLSRWYASSDVFVFPSTTETFGNVVLEAFASGLPVIGVNRGGVAELIFQGKNGFLSPPHDSQNIAYFLKLLIKNESYRKKLGQRASKMVRAYNWTSVNEQLINSYSQIITKYYSRN
ncbi:MAG: glycosyltransferase family 1 protein [Calditrichaeota bacterium]|nr:glycosyltransferase family 1 protein [Calditrichota bacterium]RQW08243.1 MAG: glycosyltransferase family 1 protein [Calditrichota bacterium]